MISADFFTSGISSDILMNVLEDCIIFLVWAACVLFSFYFKQKQIQSGALMKMPTSFHSMEEVCLDVLKLISL